MGRDSLLDEGVWRQARSDAIAATRTLRFWMLQASVGAAAGAGATLLVFLSDSWSLVAKAALPPVAVLGAVLSVVVFVFLGSLFRAPYRQRDEARRALRGVLASDVTVELVANGRRAEVHVANGDIAGDFQVLVDLDGLKYYAPWDQAETRSLRILTGDTGIALVARLERNDEYLGGFCMSHPRAEDEDTDEPGTASAWSPEKRERLSIRVLRETGKPIDEAAVLGMAIYHELPRVTFEQVGT